MNLKKISLIAGVILLLDFIIVNLLTIKGNNLTDSYNLMISSTMSFVDIKQYVFTHSIICLILYIFIDDSNIYTLIKFKSRKNFYLKYRLPNIFIASFIYSLIIIIVLTIYGATNFGLKNLLIFNFFKTAYFSFIYDLLYFIIICLIYEIINIIFSNKVASIIGVEIILNIFYLISEKIITILIIPSKYDQFNNLTNFYLIIPSLIYIIIAIIALTYFNYQLFQEKDIL